MAIVGLGTTWISAGNEDSITYQNGETVNYTYGSTGTDASGPGISTILGGGQAFIDFDVPAHGVVIGLSSVHRDASGYDSAKLSIDGELIDIDQWITDGKLSISGGDAIGNGENVANGTALYPSGSGAYNYSVTFHVPVSTVTVTNVPSGERISSGAIIVDMQVDDAAAQDVSSLPCFTAGTLIDTDQGPVPVETLQAGDLIRTKDHGFQPVKWVGASRVYATGFDVPLRIKAGTFGNTRDLVVSKRHKMLMNHTHLSLMFDVEEAFACAMHLRNDDTIVREPEGWVTYYHILLPQHEVIYAEGAATESFYPDEGTLDTMATKTREELLQNFTPETYGPPARPTLDPTRAMWIGRNLDILKGDDMGQIAAYENAMKAAQ